MRGATTNASHNTNPRASARQLTGELRESADPEVMGPRGKEDGVHHENEEAVVSAGKWTRDAIRVRKWVDKADESVEGDKPVPVPEVNWKVFTMLRKEGRQAPRSEEINNEGTARTDMCGERQDDDKNPAKDNLAAIMALIRPALDASLSKGTKQQKSSMLRYCGIYCAAFHIKMDTFKAEPTGSSEEVRYSIHR